MMGSMLHKQSVYHLECKEETSFVSKCCTRLLGSSGLTLTCNFYTKDNVQSFFYCHAQTTGFMTEETLYIFLF